MALEAGEPLVSHGITNSPTSGEKDVILAGAGGEVKACGAGAWDCGEGSTSS